MLCAVATHLRNDFSPAALHHLLSVSYNGHKLAVQKRVASSWLGTLPKTISLRP